MGLLGGVFLPTVSAALKPHLPSFVAALLFFSALRIGPQAALGNLSDLRRTGALALAMQLALPLIALVILAAFGVADTKMGLAFLLICAGSSITGSPNFAALMGHDPAPAMRLLILGTALFPLTMMPVFWLSPAFGDPSLVFVAALRLVAVILLAVGAGFAIRLFWRTPSPDQIKALDGASALALAGMVIGLMFAFPQAIRTEPHTVLAWFAMACAANFGLQLITYKLLKSPGEAIVAGNRNIALYLVGLPASVTDPLLIFIACYQIPMYLTPIVMSRIYAKR